MKLDQALSAKTVWFSADGRVPQEWRVVGHLDLGQDKYITLAGQGKVITVDGERRRMNGWGHQADFAFAESADEWYALLFKSHEARRKPNASQDGFDFALGNKWREVSR